MQTLDAKVRIGGDLANVVAKYDITPAELQLLRYLNGEDAVIEITVKGNVDRTPRDERERLSTLYASPQHPPLIQGMWRDFGGTLPVSIDDLALGSHLVSKEAPPLDAADVLD